MNAGAAASLNNTCMFAPFVMVVLYELLNAVLIVLLAPS